MLPGGGLIRAGHTAEPRSIAQGAARRVQNWLTMSSGARNRQRTTPPALMRIGDVRQHHRRGGADTVRYVMMLGYPASPVAQHLDVAGPCNSALPRRRDEEGFWPYPETAHRGCRFSAGPRSDTSKTPAD